MKGTLYITATPIGNMEDITARAKRILAEADIVAAEDTRTAKKLLGILGIKNKTVSNHKFNEKQQEDYLIAELEKGRNVVLVSDAGTPCIADPGAVIAGAAVQRGIAVTGVCGPSAVIAALSVCGFCFNSFAFYGFLPRTGKEQKKTMCRAADSGIDAAVFFESPKRIKKTMLFFAASTPDAEFCLCNDLTKMYERIYRGTAARILEELNANLSAEKGEYTLVINLAGTSSATAGRQPAENIQHEPGTPGSAAPETMLVEHIFKTGDSPKDAVNALAEKHKNTISKKEFYAASLRLRRIFGVHS